MAHRVRHRVGDRPGAQVIEVGGSTTDHNAALVHRGQVEELGPRYAAGDLRLVSSRFVEGWDNQAAGQVFEQLSAPFLPRDSATFASEGVVKLPDLGDGSGDGFALEGFFAPTGLV